MLAHNDDLPIVRGTRFHDATRFVRPEGERMIGRCFVAMAFGHPDTDSVFARFIKPTLRREQLTPIRADKKEHNRDIDDVIMEELKKAVLVIADLTYARQSVYFEAGFAERVVPVIYTARADHLGRSLADDRRIHFDLTMRNIISWSNPQDRTFSSRLGRRVRHVVRPLARSQAELRAKAAIESVYRAKPAATRILKLVLAAALELKGAGFKPPAGPSITAPWRETLARSLSGVRDDGRVTRSVVAVIASKFSPKDLTLAEILTMPFRTDNLQTPQSTRRVLRREHTLIVATESPINTGLVRQLRPHASLGSNARELVWQEETDAGSFLGKRHPASIDLFRLHLLDNVQSDVDFRSRLGKVINGL